MPVYRLTYSLTETVSRVSSENDSVGCRIFYTLTPDSPRHLSLVRECLSLEDKIGCKGMTQGVLDGDSVAEVRGMSKSILKLDWERCLCDARNRQSTAVAAEIASSISWLKLWDVALDYGPRRTASLQALFRELTLPSFGSKPCHLCDIDHLCVPYFDHFISSHSSIEVSSDIIVHQLAEGDRDIFMLAKHFPLKT